MAMSNLIIEPTTREHCRSLAPRMKAADVREVRLASGLDPFEALEASLVVSQQASAVLLEGQVVALSGVAAPVDYKSEMGTATCGTATCGTATCGIVWALTAPLTGWEKTFWKASQQMIASYQEEFPLLTNFCDVDNKETIGYLKRLGFIFLRREEQFGVAEKPFYQFVRIR